MVSLEEIKKFQEEYQKRRETEKIQFLKEHEKAIAPFNAPEPLIPPTLQPLISSFDQFMNELYEMPEVDIGYRNAIQQWERAWGVKGKADGNDWNYYKDKMLYIGSKEEQAFHRMCTEPKGKGTLKVGDECYKKSFDIYRNYAKSFFTDTLNAVDNNLSKKQPFYRFLVLDDAENFIEDVKKKTSDRSTGIHWSWDLDKHRNIVNPSYDIIRKKIKQKDYNSYDAYIDAHDKELEKWRHLFFRGYITDPKGVDIHASVSSNMGGLDHAEIRMKPNSFMKIDRVCVHHDYESGWKNIRLSEANGCVAFSPPISLSVQPQKKEKNTTQLRANA